MYQTKHLALLDLFAKEICNTDFGLFSATSEQTLTVNNLANIIVGEHYLQLYYFMGKMLGKALYEVS